ncbi:DUF4266 domain-containing protein [Aequorivita sp. CIP111184]|uniref:DUF4266 domain-containing protein n=1 Tax=Aequorivita sp. CIP111184 TaxID=2211356 RepID=UPI000DD0ABBF|nr:DUF4266 domain-containing protein [Aequorivita sp. CIP111184]
MGLTISCTALKEYEKINLNDPDMALSQKKQDRFETNFQVYRESSAGANGGKSGGGCGCN